MRYEHFARQRKALDIRFLESVLILLCFLLVKLCFGLLVRRFVFH